MVGKISLWLEETQCFYSVPVCGSIIRIKRTENLTIQINLQSDTVENALADNAVVVGPSATLSQVLSLMKEQGVGSVLVCVERKLVGIFTERDALKTMVEEVDLDTPISDLMIIEVLTIAEGTPAGKCNPAHGERQMSPPSDRRCDRQVGRYR